MGSKSLRFIVGQMLTTGVVGGVIARCHRDKLKRHGIWFDVAGRPSFIKAAIFWGLYERSEIRYLKKYLLKDLPIIELGASIGCVTGHLAALCRKPIIAVEANPYAVTNLLRMIALNRYDNIQVENLVVDYSKCKHVPFRIDDGGLGSHKVPQNDASSVLINTGRLCELKRKYNVGEYVLVADIEGAEVEMFMREEENAAIRDCRQIFIELHKTNYCGIDYTTTQISHLISAKWGMMEIFNDGKVWLFERK